MRILFNLYTTIEVPDAGKFPPKEEIEKELVEFFFADEGIIAHGLEITDYRAITDEEERKDDNADAIT